jgi:hypothetical protein
MLEELNYSKNNLEIYKFIDTLLLYHIDNENNIYLEFEHVALYFKLILLKTEIKREEYLTKSLGLPNEINNLLNLENVQLIPKQILIDLTNIIKYPIEERRAKFNERFDLSNLESEKLISISYKEMIRLNNIEFEDFKKKTEQESTAYNYSIKNKELEIKIRLLENEVNELKSAQIAHQNEDDETKYSKLLEESLKDNEEEMKGMNYSLLDEIFNET